MRSGPRLDRLAPLWLALLAACAAPPAVEPRSAAPMPEPVAPEPGASRQAQPRPDPPGVPRSAIYYVSDCGAGADPDCVPGDDQSPGTDPAAPWRSYEKARNEFSRLAPGESIAFARGGVFPHAERHRWNNARCRAERPCVVTDYAPPWGSGDEGRPRVLGGSYGFDFSNPGRPRHHEGYVLRNLAIASDGVERDRRWGIFLHNDVDDVLLEGLVVEGFSIGVHLASGKDDARSERIVLRESRIANNRKQGWLGGADGVRIEDNHFENNGWDSGSEHAALRHHNLYLNESSRGVVIRGNTLQRASLFDHDADPGTPPVCHGTSLVVHGEHEDLLIEDNLVMEEHAGPHCWGIGVDGGRGYDAYPGLSIRNNRVVDVGAVSIGCTSCSDAVIEGNEVIQRNRFESHGIVVPTKRRPATDGPTAGVRVRNNALWFAGGDATGILVGEEGEGYEIAGNSISHAGPGRLRCYQVDTIAAGYARIDHNTCHHPRPDALTWVEDRGRRMGLPAWRARSGWDEHSAIREPDRRTPETPASDPPHDAAPQ